MTHKHKHDHCKHKGTLEFCECCSVVYCTNCGKEWPEKVVVEKITYRDRYSFPWAASPRWQANNYKVEGVSGDKVNTSALEEAVRCQHHRAQT